MTYGTHGKTTDIGPGHFTERDGGIAVYGSGPVSIEGVNLSEHALGREDELPQIDPPGVHRFWLQDPKHAPEPVVPDEYQGAQVRIRPHIQVTPLHPAPILSKQTGNVLYLKREDLQATGSFKLRGAANALVLSATEHAQGVMTVSAGNHAQGIAMMARILGIPATVIMPTTAPQPKINAVERLGAAVHLAGNNYSEAFELSAQLRVDSKATFIHPFDDPAVIAGQGTIGLELLRQQRELTHVFVPVGGGGLLAGVAEAIKRRRSDIAVIGVQYDMSDAMAQSIAAGRIVDLARVGRFSDGTAVARVGEETFRRVKDYADDIVTVGEDDIVRAIRDIYTETGNFSEPAGALAVAGLMQYVRQHDVHDQKMAAIVSGGNIAPERIGQVLERAALLDGKRALLRVELPERPGALKEFLAVLGTHNINRFRYAYNGSERASVLFGIHLVDSLDKQALLRSLERAAYTYDDYTSDFAIRHAEATAGGPSLLGSEEISFAVEFPERPGALTAFLDVLGDKYTITRFDYSSDGSESGSVLLSLRAPSEADASTIRKLVAQTQYAHREVQVPLSGSLTK